MTEIEQYISHLDEEGESRPHHGLKVWRKSLKLVEDIYDITNEFPEQERYGLSAQLKRAATSVPSNIAEGAARNTKKEFRNGSSNSEVETQLLISAKLGFTRPENVQDLLKDNGEISRMIFGLQNSLD